MGPRKIVKIDRSYLSAVPHDEAAGEREHPWRFAYREALSPYVSRRVLLVIGLYLGAYITICPLGTQLLTWTQRVAYLSLCTLLTAPLLYAEYVVTLYLTRFWTPLWITLTVAAVTFIATPTVTAIAFGVDTLVFAKVLPAADLSTVYVFVTLSIALCAAVVHCLVSHRLKNESAGNRRKGTVPEAPPPGKSSGDTAAAPADGSDGPARPSNFIHRLPAEVGHDIIYLKMSDHYLEVVTSEGRCTILMRFADAVHDLGSSGIRVHRSYWIALAHVEGWERSGQRTLLRLTGGHLIPVRPHLPCRDTRCPRPLTLPADTRRGRVSVRGGQPRSPCRSEQVSGPRTPRAPLTVLASEVYIGCTARTFVQGVTAVMRSNNAPPLPHCSWSFVVTASASR